MWELKPEYRHYKDDQPAEGKDDKSDSDWNSLLIYHVFNLIWVLFLKLFYVVLFLWIYNYK